MTFFDLKQKEVINCKDCMKLGYVADIELDPCNGQLCGLIVPAPSRFFSCFYKCVRYYIRFPEIVRIGPDIILVDVCIENAIMNEE